MAAPLRCFYLKELRMRGIDAVIRKHVLIALRTNYRTLGNRTFCVSNKLHTVRVRFAPSPTGGLHLGGLRTALYNYLFAKSRNGSFLLRIEDTDRVHAVVSDNASNMINAVIQELKVRSVRCFAHTLNVIVQTRIVPGAIDRLQEILNWAGIIPDEGPDQGGEYGPYIQSERLQVYNDNVKTLLDNGWAYPCFCTARRLELMRKEAAQKGEPSKYDNRCRHLSGEQIEKFLDKKTPFVIRLKLEPTPKPWDDSIKGLTSHDIYSIEGDPVLLKSDGYPTYHFANVVDDHYMGITHVLRGSEWLSSTPKHILLYKAFGWSPPEFGHLPLIVNPDGSKLSKRQGDVNVQEMRDADHFPESILSYVTSIGGGFAQSTQGMSLGDMCKSFDLSLIRKHTGRLDPLRLKEVAIDNLHKHAYSDNPVVLKSLTDRLHSHVREAYKDSLSEASLQQHVFSQDYLTDVIRWGLKDQRVSVLHDFVQPELSYLWKTPNKSQMLELVEMEPNALEFLKMCLQWMEEENADNSTDDDKHLNLEQISDGLKTIIAREKLKPRQFFHFMRKALTGDVQGPPVAEMISVLGRKNVVLRLKTALDLVTGQRGCES